LSQDGFERILQPLLSKVIQQPACAKIHWSTKGSSRTWRSVGSDEFRWHSVATNGRRQRRRFPVASTEVWQPPRERSRLICLRHVGPGADPLFLTSRLTTTGLPLG